MATSDSVSWSQVVAKGARMRVITPTRRARLSAISTDILFEDQEFTKQQMARKAAAIVRQALTPNSVLFSIPTTAFAHRSDIYKAIEAQIGPLEDVRPLSLYDVRARRDFLIEAKFADPLHNNAAIENGVTIDDVVYTASPSFVGAENPLIRVQLNLMQMGNSLAIKQGLLDSLRYYGKVYQIRRILDNGYFEGQLTITIDPSEGHTDEDGNFHKAQPLQRMMYLETWDTFAPATFKGAAPVCFYCRQAGHLRNACPELAKRVCFGCGITGHTRKYCKATVNDSQAIELYEQASAEQAKKTKTASIPALEESTTDKKESKHRYSPVNADLHSDEEQTENQEMADEENSSIAAVAVHQLEDLDHSEEDIEMDIELPSKKKLEEADPAYSMNSSKWAPYDKATMMKVDEEEHAPLDQIRLSTLITKSTGRRPLIKNKPPLKNTHADQHVDLDLVPVIPSPLNIHVARKGQ